MLRNEDALRSGSRDDVAVNECIATVKESAGVMESFEFMMWDANFEPP